MNPKFAKLATKAAFGVPFTIALGLLVKANYAVDDKIDEYYENKNKVPETPEN